jgi:hypothetical protein
MNDEERDKSFATIQAPLSEVSMSAFTCRQWVTLLALRRRYRAGNDLWSARELAYLRFLRWRRTTGHLDA